MNATTTYREINATPSAIGGIDGGKVHRLYSTALTIQESRALRGEGWRAVDLTTGFYANTTLVKEANKLGVSLTGLIWAK